MNSNQYYIGTGRRKESTATVFLKNGVGQIEVNKREGDKYFASDPFYRKIILNPLKVINKTEEYDLKIRVKGGGFTGQKEAIRLALARTLLKIFPELKITLKSFGLLTCDSRRKERKKYGLKSARVKPPLVKR